MWKLLLAKQINTLFFIILMVKGLFIEHVYDVVCRKDGKMS